MVQRNWSMNPKAQDVVKDTKNSQRRQMIVVVKMLESENCDFFSPCVFNVLKTINCLSEMINLIVEIVAALKERNIFSCHFKRIA